MRLLRTLSTLLFVALLCSACSDSDLNIDDSTDVASKKPNILLVIMDDVGIDQMQSMGYGGVGPLATTTPNIDDIASEGVRFRNTWSMPECSPGRATIFSGRYPLRNNVFQALGPSDLANSQLSSYTLTTPKLLEQAGYQSAMFGKFHMAGPEYNVDGAEAALALGWDYFYGWLGLPGTIDTTAGGIAPEGTYACGYVPRASEGPNGASTGACYIPTAGGGSTCQQMVSQPPRKGDSAGLQCVSSGGVLVPNASCQTASPDDLETPPGNVKFDLLNAHYVSPLVILDDSKTSQIGEVPPADPRTRGYRSTIEADATIKWINSRKPRDEGGKPWMATLSFSAIHTPFQPPPAALAPSRQTNHYINCDAGGAPGDIHQLTNAMLEALDKEMARVMVSTGIAKEGDNGKLVYQPDSNTVVIIVGDNGSLPQTVKLPFDASRAKGSAYQTGVWVPLIVAGPKVAAPGRPVNELINTTDLYHLFGEIAGLDVDALTEGRTDGSAMRAYLTNPNKSPIRQFNYTQGGLNLQLNGGRNGPCVFDTPVGRSCSHTPMSKSICEDNGGEWWGAAADDASVPQQVRDDGGLKQCWQVNQAVYKYESNSDPQQYEQNRVTMMANFYEAVRDSDYKLVHNTMMDYDVTADDGVEIDNYELYEVNQSADASTLKLDREGANLLPTDGDPLTSDGQDPSSLGSEAFTHYTSLKNRLDAIHASQPDCPGDGNRDGVVDQTDIDNVLALFDRGWHGSSTYDYNLDGKTDQTDLDTINQNMGVCN